MKKSRLILSLITSFLFLSVQLNAQQITLSGQVFHKKDFLEKAIFKIYHQDSLISSTEANRSGKFKIKVEAGKEYRLEVCKEDFVAKTILLTALIEDNGKVPPFEFDVALFKSRDFRYVDITLIADPVAHIFYNNELGMLDWDKELTQSRTSKIVELRKQNSINRREKSSNF